MSKKKFTKSLLAQAIAAKNGSITPDQALAVLNTMDDIIAAELKNQDVYLDNIGTFSRVIRKATHKNVIVGEGKREVREIPEHVSVKLRPSKTLIDRVQ